MAESLTALTMIFFSWQAFFFKFSGFFFIAKGPADTRCQCREHFEKFAIFDQQNSVAFELFFSDRTTLPQAVTNAMRKLR
jgi:hypothetical protein